MRQVWPRSFQEATLIYAERLWSNRPDDRRALNERGTFLSPVPDDSEEFTLAARKMYAQRSGVEQWLSRSSSQITATPIQPRFLAGGGGLAA
jgi:hypothetical protein